MPVQILFFALATLLPIPLIWSAAVAGGGWVWAALGYLAALSALLDRIVTATIPATEDREFPAADWLSVKLGLLHFPLLIIVVHSLATQGLSPLEKTGLLIAAGLFFGQVSNANAHELIHRSRRGLRWLGMWVYISLYFGHHTSAHPLVHHRYVATRADPSSARLGESFYRFVPRAWRGSFRMGLAAERDRLARAGRSRWHNPYLVYCAGAALTLAVAWMIGGVAGVIAHLALALMAQSQLLMSDYVQHYGLHRALGPDGRPEPLSPRHSWNSPHPASSAMLLNAPRHSDHHAHPSKSFPSLDVPPEAPTLPRGLPAMAFLALWPAAWRRVMDPRAAHWRDTPAHGGVTGGRPPALAV